MTLQVDWEIPESDVDNGDLSFIEVIAHTEVGVATVIPKLGEREGLRREHLGYNVDVWLFDVRPDVKRRRDEVVNKVVTSITGAKTVGNRILRNHHKLAQELAKPKRKPRKSAKRGKK